MKRSKVLLVFAFVFVALLLSGCGKKQTLYCEASESGVDVDFNVAFSGHRIENIEIKYDMDCSKYNDTQIEAIKKQDFCSIVQESMSQYKNAFTECTQSVENKKLHVETGLDIDKLAENELQKFSSVDDAKEELEEVGYTCTIK